MSAVCTVLGASTLPLSDLSFNKKHKAYLRSFGIDYLRSVWRLPNRQFENLKPVPALLVIRDCLT
jgi:hypothetical protein